VLSGAVAMLQPELSGDFARIMTWADEARRMRVRTNAETPADAQTARSFGAEGIGLCRTEHMFFEDGRIDAMREMIIASSEQGRRAALDKLLPMQKSDFVELFEIMAGLPVTIRLLDPPLHEFLPKTDDEIAEVAASLGIAQDELRRRVDRLAISYPEIAEMQARAIFEAAIEAGAKTGKPVVPEIMVPLVGLRAELVYVKERIDTVAHAVMAEAATQVDYLVGTMIELPRAAVRAHVIAEVAEFFSFGTNDLTQTTFGISRDDAASFIETYIRKGIVKIDPLVSLDVEGVGELIRLASSKGKQQRPDIKLGICGEHGGDPASIAFCEDAGLDYVSCSPFRVPIARLAAAQSAIRAKG
jgi:pyruvate, orthophosphate dikinase